MSLSVGTCYGSVRSLHTYLEPLLSKKKAAEAPSAQEKHVEAVRAFATPRHIRDELDAGRLAQARARERKQPVMCLPGTLDRMVDSTLQHLSQRVKDLYYYGREVCTVERDDLTGRPALEAFDVNAFRVLADRECCFLEPTVKRDPVTRDYYKHIDPPDNVVKGILKAKNPAHLRRLRAVLRAPTIYADGRVRTTLGYDEQDQTYLFDTVELDELGEPTKEDALSAYEYLSAKLFAEFNFTSRCRPFGESYCMAMLLTSVCGPGLQVKSPLWAVSAVDQGSGKSTLVSAVAHVTLGQGFGTLALPTGKNAQEVMERLSVKLDAAVSMAELYIYFDNWYNKIAFGSSDVAQALTEVLRGVRPYHSNSTIRYFLNYAMWIVNGNNLRIMRDSDLPRRTLMVELAKSDIGKNYALGDTADMMRWICENRSDLLRKCFVVMRAFIRQGYDAASPVGLSSFAAWDRYVRQCILWLGKADPLLANEYAQQEYVERSEGNLSYFLKTWYAVHGDTRILLKELTKHGGPPAEKIRTALETYYEKAVVPPRTGGTSDINAVLLSNALEGYSGKQLGALEIHKLDARRGGSHLWQVRLARGRTAGDVSVDDAPDDVPRGGNVVNFPGRGESVEVESPVEAYEDPY